jgi:DNA replication protein DnaC
MNEPTPWPLADVVTHQTFQLVDNLEARFAASLPSGAWDKGPQQAAIIPIPSRGETGRPGVLVAGLNPFRQFDDTYRNFLVLAAGEIAASFANAQAYEDERRRAEALAEIDRAKTLFFSNVSHEFSTPLTLMLSPLEEVLAKPPSQVSPDNRALIEVAHRNSLRLLKLVNSLLDFSRIEAGRAQATYEATDLANLTSDLASNFRSACERAGLRLVIDCPPLIESVYVDRDMWEKMVLNLLSNAFKPLTAGGDTMLTHPTHDRLVALGLTGMARALEEQRKQPDISVLAFEERIGLMIDREAIERENKRLATRLKFAALRQNAVVEDINLRATRGLDRALFQKLVAGDWIDRKQNLIIVGPTGIGKSWIACALGHKACRDNRAVLYQRVPRMFDTLALARGDGRHARLIKGLARVQLLILDDWGLATLTPDQARDLLEIVDDRHDRGSTIVTSQLPVEHWHETIANPTLADAILDRLVHNAHRLTLTGDSLRKAAGKRVALDASGAP